MRWDKYLKPNKISVHLNPEVVEKVTNFLNRAKILITNEKIWEVTKNISTRLETNSVISAKIFNPQIKFLKETVLKEFLEFQQFLKQKALLPSFSRNCLLNFYSPKEIQMIEDGHLISRIHAIPDMRCNLHCLFCSRGIENNIPNPPLSWLLRTHRENNQLMSKLKIRIPKSDLLQVISEGFQPSKNDFPRLREICFDGGEPFFDWKTIQEILLFMEKENKKRPKEKMMRAHFFTNTLFFNKNRAQWLASLPFVYLTVNFIAADKQFFEWFTRTPNSYEKVKMNIEYLISGGKKYKRATWLMGATVPMEENKKFLLKTTWWMLKNNIMPVIQPLRLKERGKVNFDKGLIHPLNFSDHLRFLVWCWLISLRMFLENGATEPFKSWLWDLETIFPSDEPGLKKRGSFLRYPFDYSGFLRLFKKNKPGYQMLMKIHNKKIDWGFGEYGTKVINGKKIFKKVGHSFTSLWKLHKKGKIRYDLEKSGVVASDYTARHGGVVSLGIIEA